MIAMLKQQLSRLPLLLPVLLCACTAVAPPTSPPPPVPTEWYASLPQTDGQTNLAQWWQRQSDATLVQLIAKAQVASPSVAQAFTRIQNARLAASASYSAQLPSLDAAFSASRAHEQSGFGPATSSRASLQTSWEIDLYGANRAANQATLARWQGSNAQWHDARISVAAEVANLYVDYIACRQLLAVTQQDAASRALTAGILTQSAAQGMSAQVSVAQANAATAEANNRVLQQQTQCQQALNGLVVLTAIPQPELQPMLSQAVAQPLKLQALALASVPASLLRQRPDIFAAERDVAAASLEVGVAEAKRYPTLSLNGSVGILRHAGNGATNTMHTWSIGPLTIHYPLIDGGQRRANIDAAKAQYTEAATLYAAKVRVAVKEVEEALLNLNSTNLRQREADVASRAYATTLAATEARRTQGMASTLEVEEARRVALAAESTQWGLQQERNRAFVALYRALGGGWGTADRDAADRDVGTGPAAPSS